MDYTFVSYLTPKPQRQQKQNTTPEEWKKICEERDKLLMQWKELEEWKKMCEERDKLLMQWKELAVLPSENIPMRPVDKMEETITKMETLTIE